MEEPLILFNKIVFSKDGLGRQGRVGQAGCCYAETCKPNSSSAAVSCGSVRKWRFKVKFTELMN